MKRAAIYVRMSTDDQADSPARQRSQILPYCERLSYSVVAEYEDLGMRGSDDSRPQFQRLLVDAQTGKFDVIVVDEVSRLSRKDPLDYFATVAHPLREAGVVVESVAEGRMGGDGLVSMILATVHQDKASQESWTLGRRTLTGQLRDANKATLFVGRSPYGYAYKVEDGRRVGYVPGDPEHVGIVRFIFEAYVYRDASIRAIVAELNARGTAGPRGGRWNKNAVNRILVHPVYAGDYVFGRVLQGKFYRYREGQVVKNAKRLDNSEKAPRSHWLIVPQAHEPIVGRDVFDKAQTLLDANRIRRSNSRIRKQYPLSQLLRCSHCGATMYATKVTSGGVRYPVYRCGSDMNGGACRARQAREALIIEKLVETVQMKFLDPVNLDRLRAAVVRQSEQEAGQAAALTESLVKKVAKLDREIADAKRKLPRIPEDMLADYITDVRQMEKERAQAQTQLEHARQASPVENFDKLVARVRDLAEVVRSADPFLVRTLLRECIDHVDLRFHAVPKAKVTRYPLAGGTIHLRESANLARSGPAVGR